MALPETALITELNNKDVYMSNFQETKATVTLTDKVVSNMDVPGHTDELKCFWIHRASRYEGAIFPLHKILPTTPSAFLI